MSGIDPFHQTSNLHCCTSITKVDFEEAKFDEMFEKMLKSFRIRTVN